MSQPQLPGLPMAPADLLRDRHYLGPVRGGDWYEDADGVLVFDAPTARNLPVHWIELVRWCITGGENAGSAQWARAVRWLRGRSRATTVVSYSDPSVGHTGALYRACGWLWAPTWHRLRPPPTGNGSWTVSKLQSVKDRWIFPLRHDAEREAVLALKDDSLQERFRWAEYRDPRWKRGRATGGGGDYARWIAQAPPSPTRTPPATPASGEAKEERDD